MRSVFLPRYHLSITQWKIYIEISLPSSPLQLLCTFPRTCMSMCKQKQVYLEQWSLSFFPHHGLKKKEFHPVHSCTASYRWSCLNKGIAPDDVPASSTLCFWNTVSLFKHTKQLPFQKGSISPSREPFPLFAMPACCSCRAGQCEMQRFEKHVQGNEKELSSLKRVLFELHTAIEFAAIAAESCTFQVGSLLSLFFDSKCRRGGYFSSWCSVQCYLEGWPC